MKRLQTLNPWSRVLVVASATLMLAQLSACSEGTAMNDEDTRPAHRVLVNTVQAQTLELERSFAARTEGSMVTEVRARVGGQLEERHFNEGQLVEKGTIMFSIEKAPYKVDLQKAQAELTSAEATYNEARRDWARVENLFSDGAVSAREFDQTQSRVESAEAELEGARATLEDVKLRYNYTEISAPITGVASRESVSVGNLIQANDTLATIVSLDPIYVHFNVPESDIAANYLLRATSLSADDERPGPAARLRFSDGREHTTEGYIDYVSRIVDRETGSIEARAVIPNPDMTLLPGQFVRVQLPQIELQHAITVSQRAVVQSGRHSVVYIVDNQDIVQVREVTLGVRVGNQQLIEQGLASGDRVIVEGLSMLQPGTRVHVEEDE
ncbi:efflux RND transporter periplasmic adaptor subunit [Aliidiomarina halalkaliphila]|uniref:Efflux RND transporter periplasmic adaptor subunit n=1 Tax=Aliidiomarina halalkaliphila TaxID=2593535 RepID=A0A552X163_9GAMM|nr:efflux RND transporter periplasmic adaptor subunit [Aliidiomarina halalkaliphila]TRW48333.1 efflux RND transporter periplasmic adaptor subunit [Aliidiomarina halalkaliphila]